MKQNRWIPVILVLLLNMLAWPVNSQPLRKFSSDSTRFIGELHQLFSQISKEDQKIVEPVLIAFQHNWESEQFAPASKRRIYEIGNGMLDKKMRPFPDFYHFLQSLNVVVETHQQLSIFEAWSSILDTLIGAKYSRHFLKFLEFSVYLFKDDLLYRSSSTSWKISNPAIRLGFDSVPWVDLEETDLICYSNRDSLTIYRTHGRFFPLATRWAGTGGRVDWKRAGLDPEKVFARLDRYQVQMNFSRYEADSVEFYNLDYFRAPLPGKLVDKVQADMDEEKASYPRFYSYENLIGIPNIFRDVDYLGGFSMEGRKVVGFGVENRDAEVTFRRNDTVFVTARAGTFIIRPDRINSANASVTIHLDRDSIYHPGLVLKYLESDEDSARRILSLNKDERISLVSPWFDTWHNVEIYGEALTWRLSEPLVRFEAMQGPGSSSRTVFESGNYYSFQRYEKLRGIDEFNPLHVLKKYSEKTKSREFTLKGLVEYWKMPPAQIESQLLMLRARGFLIYDPDARTGVIKDKLIHYVDASHGKTDYDEIFFTSEVEGESNAILNLQNYDMKIQGVSGVFLSDSQHVYIEPLNQEIILRKNRDFVFSGKVEAGLFDFYAANASFEYGRFRLNLPAIDSLEFYVISRVIDPKTGRYPMKKVQTALNDLNGFLLIDDPNNKAGLKNFPEYPVFTNNDTARVNWDKPHIHRGVYQKESFYFDVLPFTLHSLDYIDTDSLQFRGYLVSAGIFPVIEEPLKVRPDFSLGFEQMTPPEGYPVYGGKGTYTSRVDLSNKGLYGDGRLAYLNSVSASDRFLFFPDSMTTLARGFVLSEQIAAVEYPAVTGDSVAEKWVPYLDSMQVTSLRKEIAMYNNQAMFEGTLGLTPSGLGGTGTVLVKDAEMDSKGFSFQHHTFDALIADFRIKSFDLNQLAISTKNYRTHFDFEERRGEFRSNLGISTMEFPINQYVCSMDRFDWLIDNEEILLTNEENQKYVIPDNISLAQLIDVGYTGTEFISVHPAQDSLRFFALRARFAIRSNIIDAEEVRIIKVADAAIFPDSGKVRILRDAVIPPLINANIIANTSLKQHSFYDASVSITGRKGYTASATYDYTDRNGDHQKISFFRIMADTAGQTRGEGRIPDSSGFMLSPEFAFAGTVSLYAPVRNLTFSGTFQAQPDCQTLGINRVKFSSGINPGKISLPVGDPVQNNDGTKLLLGLAYSGSGNVIYPAFFIPKRSPGDSVLVSVNGTLTYQVQNTTFTIAPRDSAGTIPESATWLSLNDETCQMHAEGPIHLGLGSGPLAMETYGTIDHFIIPDSTLFRLAMVFNFPFEEQVLSGIQTQISSTNLSGIQLFQSPYRELIAAKFSPEELGKLQSEMESVGKFRRYPEGLKKTFIFGDVRLYFDTVSRSFLSYGPIGLASIGEQMVNRYCSGKMELTRKKGGDEFTIYLEVTPNDWYYFNFRNNVLLFLSSDLEMNDRVKEAPLNKSELKRVNRIWKGFVYKHSDQRKKRDFLRKHGLGEE